MLLLFQLCLFVTKDRVCFENVMKSRYLIRQKCDEKLMSTQPGIRARVLAVPRPICNGQRKSRTKGQRPDSNAEIDQMSCKEQSEHILKLPTFPSNN